MKVSLYTDGGCVKSNPSKIGGTIAFTFVKNNQRTFSYARVWTPKQLKVDRVTNNQTELWALIVGLQYTAFDDVLHIYSDSEITLGRVFMGYAMRNIPEWMQKELNKQKRRLANWDKFKWTLLAGHPTKPELDSGLKNSKEWVLPVSEFNVWCDSQCQRVAAEYLVKHPQ